MADSFDIFEILGQDAVRWIGTAASLGDAEAAIQRSASEWPTRDYLILNQRTGQKTVVSRGDAKPVGTGIPSGAVQLRGASA